MVTAMNICLMGTSLGASNLGLLALADSAIKLVTERWPHCSVAVQGFLAPGEEDHVSHYYENDIGHVELWLGKNVFRSANILNVLIFSLLIKILPSFLGTYIRNHHSTIRQISSFDLVFDITGGDSFTDLYGLRGFLQQAIYKACFSLNSGPLVYLPQTYGPFEHPLATVVAKHLLRSARIVTARDAQSAVTAERLMGSENSADRKVTVSPDLAFVLERAPYESDTTVEIANLKDRGYTIVGLNVSGLLFNRTTDEVAELFDIRRLSYQDLVKRIVEQFLSIEKVAVVLVPHVFAPDNDYESDPRACVDLHSAFGNRRGRLLYENSVLDHRRVKYLIGLCDFFAGSRMHSCIAGLSQYVPTIGLAYSKKFQGVFESVGSGLTVIDLRAHDLPTALGRIGALWDDRHSLAQVLKQAVPTAQESVLALMRTTY